MIFLYQEKEEIFQEKKKRLSFYIILVFLFSRYFSCHKEIAQSSDSKHTSLESYFQEVIKNEKKKKPARNFEIKEIHQFTYFLTKVTSGNYFNLW